MEALKESLSDTAHWFSLHEIAHQFAPAGRPFCFNIRRAESGHPLASTSSVVRLRSHRLQRGIFGRSALNGNSNKRTFIAVSRPSWAIRVAVSVPLLILYSYWIFTVSRTAFNSIAGS